MRRNQPGLGPWRKAGIVLACACVAGCGRPGPAPDTSAEATPAPKPAFSPALSSRPLASSIREEALPVSDVLADMALASGDEARAALAAAYSARLSREELVKNIRDLQAQPGTNQDVVLRAMLKQLAAQNPSVALQLAMEKDPRADNEGVARMVAEQWASVDYAGLYDYSRTLESDRMKYRMGSYAVEAWSANDPAAAFEYFSGLTFQDGGGLIGIAARELAKKDPNGALEALDTVKNDQIWDMAAGRIADVIARQAPEQAVDLLFDQTDPRAAAPMAGAIAAVLAESSVTNSIGVLNKIENGNVAQSFLFGMLRSVNAGNMNEFTANFSQIADANIRASAARSLARSVAVQSPEQAQGFVASLAEDERSRAQAYSGLASGYAANDPQAAVKWFDTLPQGADRENAIYGFVAQYQWRQPAESANWAMKITDAEARQRSLRSVLANWSRRDADGARTWATQTGNLQLLPTQN